MDEDNKTTTPMLETVLERINVLAQQFQTFQENTNTQLTEMREIVVRLEEKQDKFQAELETVKNDLRTGFKKIERKVTILNDNVLTVQADNRDLENRIENLESKTS
jgi:uncharacterized protein Yka (UPF0111/DUF47 family)